MTATLAARCGAEMLGSLMTYCIAVGGVWSALLPRSKGEGMGLLAIALCAGLGIGIPIACFYRVSAFNNPGILLAFTVRGGIGAGEFFALAASELVGFVAGAVVLYIFYLPHLNQAVALPPADEIDRLLRDPAVLNDTALLNASYNLGAPAVTTQQSFWRFAAHSFSEELACAWHARKVADPFQTCPKDMQDAGAVGEGFSRTASEAGMHSATEPPQPPQQQPWGGAAAGGALGPHPSGAHQAAEEGKAAPGSPAGSDGKPARYPSAGRALDQAPTFAERLAAEGGALRSRGHLAAALCKARQDVLLSVFVTRPACWSPLFNVLQEFIAMTIMTTAALLLFEQGKFMPQEPAALWAPQAAVLVGLLNTACILALGGATGPALNPFRDLGPRIAYHFLPIPGKGCAEWHYAWVPLVGGLGGGAAAGGLAAAISCMIADASNAEL